MVLKAMSLHLRLSNASVLAPRGSLCPQFESNQRPKTLASCKCISLHSFASKAHIKSNHLHEHIVMHDKKKLWGAKRLRTSRMKSSITSYTQGRMLRKRKAKGLSILRDMKPKHLRPKKKKSGDDPQTYFYAILLLQLMSKNIFEKDISHTTYVQWQL